MEQPRPQLVAQKHAALLAESRMDQLLVVDPAEPTEQRLGEAEEDQ